MMPLDPSKRLRIRESKTLDQILGLFFVLFEVWASGQISVRHTKLLSRFAWSPHASGWKEDSSNCRTEGGHGPFRGLDAPFRAGNEGKKLSGGSQPSEAAAFFVWLFIDSIVVSIAFVWSVPWREREVIRVLRSLRRIGIATALAGAAGRAFPDALGLRMALYSETLLLASGLPRLLCRSARSHWRAWRLDLNAPCGKSGNLQAGRRPPWSV
jgi:hypothetical protein